MTIGDLWFLAEEASQRAEQVYQRLRERHPDALEFSQHRQVPRSRFRTLARRVVDSGAPFGAHTVVYREGGDLLLVRHEGVDRWVVPGGEVDADEPLRRAAERELAEEAGVEADYEGLAMATRVEFSAAGHAAWGVLPVYAARAVTTEPTVDDPDGEISEARWFADPPPDTRDREELLAWRDRRL